LEKTKYRFSLSKTRVQRSCELRILWLC
jgi:hypothetical protein